MARGRGNSPPCLGVGGRMAKGICPVCGNEMTILPQERVVSTRVTCPRCLALLEVEEVDLVKLRRVQPPEPSSGEDKG